MESLQQTPGLQQQPEFSFAVEAKAVESCEKVFRNQEDREDKEILPSHLEVDPRTANEVGWGKNLTSEAGCPLCAE